TGEASAAAIGYRADTGPVRNWGVFLPRLPPVEGCRPTPPDGASDAQREVFGWRRPVEIRQLRRGVGVLMAATVLLAACGGGTVLPPPAKTKDALAGDYVASGANGANPAMTALIARFSQLHPGVNFKLNDIDTETSIV